jgi:hypothetical protein
MVRGPDALEQPRPGPPIPNAANCHGRGLQPAHDAARAKGLCAQTNPWPQQKSPPRKPEGSASLRKPAVIRQRREQSDNDAAAFGRAGKANFHVGDHVSTAIGLSSEVLLHRMARYAMATACAQHVSRRDDLRSAAGIERHAQAGRIDWLDLADRLQRQPDPLLREP